MYLAPKDITTMERVSEAIRSLPRGAELLVVGDFNVDLASLEGDQRAEDIATSLATKELEDMARHFLPKGEEVVLGSEDVGGDQKGKGGAVPDGLHHGDGPPSLQERHSLGPSAQLGPLHCPGLSTERPPRQSISGTWEGGNGGR